MEVTPKQLLLPFFILALLTWAAPAFAQNTPAESATLQQRFASKSERFYLHASGTRLIRDDFYNSYGYGVDVGYFVRESYGLELRAIKLHSWLSAAAEGPRDDYNLVPDIRAPDALFLAGVRLFGGYGKVLASRRFVVHFDPQLSVHSGITLAEERIVPTATLGAGILSHFRFGIQAKLDLLMSFHLEQRTRGLTPSFGFLPILSVGWSPQFSLSSEGGP